MNIKKLKLKTLRYTLNHATQQ